LFQLFQQFISECDSIELLKLVNIWPSYCQNKHSSIVMAHRLTVYCRTINLLFMA